MEYSLKNQWIPCPACGGNTRTKVREDTVLYHQPLFCPKCKREYLVNVKQLGRQADSNGYCKSLAGIFGCYVQASAEEKTA